jgi:ABC-type Fe3+/spermidine/putrescine transport system ATPase subunit
LRRILRETKIPAIYVTHDQEEAFAIADRLLLLHNGVILQSGAPHEIYHHPRNVWVAQFFGLGNLISGEVIGHTPLRVKTPLGVMQANCEGDPPAPGRKATLLFRPNQAQQSPAQEANRITGKLVDQVFQGERYRLTVHVNNAVPAFQVLLPEPAILGEPITLGYAPGDVLCLSNGEDQ